MPIQTLKLNPMTEKAVTSANNKQEFEDRSDVLFSYMNMMASKNKLALNLP